MHLQCSLVITKWNTTFC